MPAHTFATSDHLNRTSLICGHCDHDALQLGEPVTHLAGDDGDPASPLHNRGTWIEVPSQCEECLHVTSVVIGFHKARIIVEPFLRVERFKAISRGQVDSFVPASL